jgi:hypothetical protein
VSVATRIERCGVCGWERGDGHDWEAHAAEQRAATLDYYETGGFPERDDYDEGPGPDAICARCGDVGVEWNVEVEYSTATDLPYAEQAGLDPTAERVQWATICTVCERPEDWPDEGPEPFAPWER